MKNRVYVFLLLALISTFTVHAQAPVIIPEPAKLSTGKGVFIIDKATRILFPVSLKFHATLLNDALFSGRTSLTGNKPKKENRIELKLAEGPSNKTPSRYSISITQKKVTVIGDDPQGLLYGVQTLIQLIQEKDGRLIFPVIEIEDWPRFSYRGMHLDCCRHFFSVEIVKKYIDWLAAYKFNYFHWHLTDDQGWRIEIKKYPKLTTIGACRNGTIIGHFPGTGNDSIKYCGYYSQNEIREIVKYASERYITIIPEIEIPGHSSAALTAYPFLGCTKGPYKVEQTWGVFDDVMCAGNDSTFYFLQDVMDEVINLFPSKLIHVGGDESPKTKWKTCPLCQQRIKDNGLKDEHALQGYFMQRIEKYLSSKGRTMIGWDEIMEGGLAANAMVMSWRGEKGGLEAASQGHYVVMTPDSHLYFDRSQTLNEDSVVFGSYVPLEKVYSYDPVPSALDSTHQQYILGAQANLWTEYISNLSKIEYMIFPRMAALSEVLWSPKEKKSWNEFEKKIPVLFRRYDIAGINYSKAFYSIKASIIPDNNYEGILMKLESNSTGSIYFSSGKDTSVRMYRNPVHISSGDHYKMILLSEDNKTILNTLKDLEINFSKATGKKITLATAPSSTYPGAGGAFGLVNGIRSHKGFSSPEWLGWNGGNMEALIDLGISMNISSASVHLLEQNESWIYLPASVEVLTSIDGINFISAGRSSAFKKDTMNNSGTISIGFPPVMARYVKIIAINHGKIEDGKPGAGNPAWLFADEIEVK